MDSLTNNNVPRSNDEHSFFCTMNKLPGAKIAVALYPEPAFLSHHVLCVYQALMYGIKSDSVINGIGLAKNF